ncbi:hypothetical protein QL285_003716 [Trifolium repens]|nr:hypothetical protein QL285_096608 [Trifolium repens]KAK2456342.1 hypothetical protein QL285_003716 [Trifolium repens]
MYRTNSLRPKSCNWPRVTTTDLAFGSRPLEGKGANCSQHHSGRIRWRRRVEFGEKKIPEANRKGNPLYESRNFSPSSGSIVLSQRRKGRGPT